MESLEEEQTKIQEFITKEKTLLSENEKLKKDSKLKGDLARKLLAEKDREIAKIMASTPTSTQQNSPMSGDFVNAKENNDKIIEKSPLAVRNESNTSLSSTNNNSNA